MRIRTNCMALLVGGLLGASAAGVPTEASWPALGALVPRRLPLIPQQSPSAAPRTTPASTPAATLQEGHWGAESNELRTLRRAEEQLFAGDTLGPPASMPQAPVSESCEAPPADEWRASSALGAGPSPRWPNGIRMPSLPVRQNPRVAKYIRYFSNSPEGRKLFTTWLRRSGRYRSVITRALEQRDLPRDLLSIVFVESGFWPTAVSSAGAVGLWQFMPQTAKAYGLNVERDYDERQSIFQATNAAADHLSDLFARFQSWDLALAAYNLGYGSLSDRLQQYGVDDFWSLAQIPDALPKETELYVPKVLAVAVLMNNLEYFGFGDVELARPIDAAELEVPSGIRLSMVARAAGTSARALRELNPQIRSDILPDRGEPLTLFVPGNGLARARSMLPTLLSRQEDRDLDREVSNDFDWGHDDLGGRGMSRLERTDPKRHRRQEQRPFWETMGDDSDRGSSDSRRVRDSDERERTSDARNGSDDSRRRLDDSSGAVSERLQRTGERERHHEPNAADATPLGPRPDDTQNSWRIRGEDSVPAPPPAAEPSAALKGDAEKVRSALGLDKRQAPTERVISYRVERGDNLTDLAASFSVNPRQVARDNGIRNPSRILKGQVLKLRVPVTTSTPSVRTEKQPPS
ncbi:MAG TPA: transglycosylase SLT domain-containing protein [Polyangiaceae bacterium]|nr:transglycosylase SLT domain-containing protein [Polyangiaceae bacterium]